MAAMGFGEGQKANPACIFCPGKPMHSGLAHGVDARWHIAQKAGFVCLM
jgi:hypothetical protein